MRDICSNRSKGVVGDFAGFFDLSPLPFLEKRGRERRLIVEDGFVRVNPWRGREDNPIEMTQRGGCLVVLLTRD